MSSLRSAFPETFFSHALAVKANSVRGVLREAARLGLGGECASLQEAKHCLSLGKVRAGQGRLLQFVLTKVHI